MITDAPIEVRGLRAGYGRRAVVDEVDLAVAAGAVTCLVGPNGEVSLSS